MTLVSDAHDAAANDPYIRPTRRRVRVRVNHATATQWLALVMEGNSSRTQSAGIGTSLVEAVERARNAAAAA